jgi:hypothetical protein
MQPSTKPRAPLRERYLPSFSLVLTRAGYPPGVAAKRSIRPRIHPVPRSFNDPLMTTIDHRYDDTSSQDISTSSLEDGEAVAIDLQNSLNNDGEVQTGSRQMSRRLSTLVIDLALDVKRKLRKRKHDQAFEPSVMEYTPTN